ncbi:MAG: hypothetical protein Q8K82_08515, partial [Gemmatimonadaceae bacterium]|nr:hypothetical protein [Gemmatimonadaceae bacterium]
MTGPTSASVRAAVMSIVLLAVTACDAHQLPVVGSRLRQAEERLVRLQQVTAEKDSLLAETLNATQLMTAINAELEKVRGLPSSRRATVMLRGERSVPVATVRDSLLSGVRELRVRLDSSEARLTRSGRRLSALAELQPRLAEQVGQLQASLAEYQSMLEESRGNISVLTSELATARSDRDRAAAEKAEVEARLLDVQDEASTVYVLAGTESQLLELGAVVKEGGGRSLLALGRKRGTTLAPSRSLDPSDFTPWNRGDTADLAGVRPGRRYAVVSRHDARLLMPPPR